MVTEMMAGKEQFWRVTTLTENFIKLKKGRSFLEAAKRQLGTKRSIGTFHPAKFSYVIEKKKKHMKMILRNGLKNNPIFLLFFP